eukprot:scaffold232788_cov32-Prasinocladus_malaysianus.AAC.1
MQYKAIPAALLYDHMRQDIICSPFRHLDFVGIPYLQARPLDHPSPGDIHRLTEDHAFHLRGQPFLSPMSGDIHELCTLTSTYSGGQH